MTKDKARAWLENHGYKVILQMGNYPSESHYIAIPRGPHKHILRGTLTGMVVKAKSKYNNNYA